VPGVERDRERLIELAHLIQERNRVEAAMAAHIGRPAHSGHIGEFIASLVFDIELEQSATNKGSDGFFRSGPLADESVNIKFYPRHGGLLDINQDGIPDWFLVLGGPWTPAITSRGSSSPWVIEHVFLFRSTELLAHLKERGVKIGVATSIIRRQWDAAEVYPREANDALPLEEAQRDMLGLFSGLSG